jgi:hypothetical protein
MLDNEKIIDEVQAGTLPYRSWEQLPKETAEAFDAFCIFRDIKIERNIKTAVESVYADKKISNQKYNVWRNWAWKFKWRERAESYYRYLEQMKQEEIRKTIEAQGELHRQVAGKMLNVVSKKLDLMNPEELTQNNVSEWANTAVKIHREDGGLIATNGKQETKQGELNFVTDFQGL